MEEENVYAQEEVVEQEEQTSEELLDQDDSQTIEEDVVTLTKSEFNKLNRRAIAYEANKKDNKTLQTKVANDVSISPERLDRIELMQDGYTRDEVDAIMELGGVRMINNPIVQNAIKVLRQEKKSKDVSQNLVSKSPVFKKFTQDDLNKMSSEEMEKILK